MASTSSCLPDRLAIFDKKTRDVIEADMVKMRRGNVGAGFAAPKQQQEKKMQQEKPKVEMEKEKPVDPEDSYVQLVEKIKKQPLEIGNEIYSHDRLTKLMAIPKRDDYATDSEEDSGDSGDSGEDSDEKSQKNDDEVVAEVMKKSEQSSTNAVRHRKPVQQRLQNPQNATEDVRNLNENLQIAFVVFKFAAFCTLTYFFYPSIITWYEDNYRSGLKQQ